VRIPLLRLTVVAALVSATVAMLGSGPLAAAAPALSSGRPASLGSGASASPVPGSGPAAAAPARPLFLIAGTQLGGIPAGHQLDTLLTLRYQVGGMALNGSAPPGRQALTISAGHLQLTKAARATGASVQASFDGGKTWHPASVTAIGGGRFRATFTAPAGAYVTLRTTAHDAAGGSITETITRGYATASRS